MKTCPICGRDNLKHQGALNIHMYHCKMKNVSKIVDYGDNLEKEKEKVQICEHEWRFLNLKAPIERKAYSHGYLEVCTQCQELKGK
jgi:hypothetical protein